jgi:predicted nucleic acid-binding protein
LIVVDASVLVHALVEDSASGEIARNRLRGQSLTAPELVDIEVLSAWRRLFARGHLTVPSLEAAMADLRDLPLRRISHRRLTPRCWELRDNLTPYDAAYVAVAELFSVPLITADAALSRAPGINCAVEVLAPD